MEFGQAIRIEKDRVGLQSLYELEVIAYNIKISDPALYEKVYAQMDLVLTGLRNTVNDLNDLEEIIAQHDKDVKEMEEFKKSV